MRGSIGVLALTGLGFLSSGVQATFLDTCPTGFECCKSATKRSLLRRTDTCPAGTPKQCCEKTEKVVKLSASTVLQCGKKGEKTSTVYVTVESCPGSATDKCIHVEYMNVATTIFNEVHLELSSLAITQSAPGQFSFNNYCSVNAGGATAACWIPLKDVISKVYRSSDPAYSLCSKDLWVAAHATISDGNTCWGQGPLIGANGNWAMDFKVTFQCENQCTKECCCPAPPEREKYCYEDTAFGQNTVCPSNGQGTCEYWLYSLGCGKNRWGWWFRFDKPPSTLTYPLIAGAGQNDVSKGYNVGSVSISSTSSGVDVMYTVNDAYSIQVAHIYLSCDPIPHDNTPCAPGQYTYRSTCLTRKTYTEKSDLKCNTYYAIFHASIAKSVPLSESCTAVTC